MHSHATTDGAARVLPSLVTTLFMVKATARLFSHSQQAGAYMMLVDVLCFVRAEVLL
jgi:hypothetical protein